MVGFKKRGILDTVIQIIIVGILLFIIATMLIPILNLFARSISAPDKSIGMSGFDIIPNGFSLNNYRMVLNHPDILRAFFNSVKITILGTILNISLTITAAYVLTRKGLVFKQVIMVFLIIMMVFDPGLVPEYLVVLDLGLINQHASIILVSAVNVYYLVIMMRFFKSLPEAIIEAATIDGAGHVTLMQKIIFPMSKAGISTITLFYFVVRWNEYFKSSIYLTSTTKAVLQVILREFVVQGQVEKIIGSQNLMLYSEAAQVDYLALKAATIFVALFPILLIYPFVLKFHTKGTLAGGVKE